MEPTPLQAQQAAIQEVRARYERGELSIEDFKRALDALVLADADECQAVLHALPKSTTATALAALDPPAPPAPVSGPVPLAEGQHKRMVAFMGQVKKLHRAWRLAPSTHTVAFMGEVQLDLNLAEIPRQTKLQITAIMGTVVIYVPPSARVSVRSTVLLSDVNALGESTSGVVAFGHEEHEPIGTAPNADIEIEAFVLMANVKVVVAERPRATLKEIVRETFRAAALGVQRGLQAPAPQTSLDSVPGQPQLPRTAEPPRRDM